MYAKMSLSMLLVLGLISVSTVQAGPVIGTAKARGDYSSNLGQSRSYASRSRSSYRYSTPMVRTAPPAQYREVAPPTAVAQAPVEARRYSYSPAPATAHAASAACGAVTTTAPEGTRRYSYQPAPTVEPAPAMSRQSSYGHGGGTASPNRSSRELWSLPKTDPRKYSSR